MEKAIKNGGKQNPFQKIQELTEIMQKQTDDQVNGQFNSEENPEGKSAI